MRLLLDTSYFLTYFKIAIEGIPYEFIKSFLENSEITVLISEISYSELVAKCFKLNLSTSIFSHEDIINGLDAIRNDSRINVISWFENPKILEIAYELRKIHSDFFDCIIFASSFLEADGIGTFDKSFYNKIKTNKEIRKMIHQINPEFRFWFFDFKNEPKLL